MNKGMKYDIFISYSIEDKKEAESMSRYFEARHLRCFMPDRKSLGEDYSKKLTFAIQQSAVVIVILSHAYNVSEHVNKEIAFFFEKKKSLLIYCIDEVDLFGLKRYYLQDLNWINSIADPEKGFEEIYQYAKRLVEVASIPVPPPVVLPTNNKTKQKAPKKEEVSLLLRRRSVAIAIFVSVFVVFGMVYLLMYEDAGERRAQGREYNRKTDKVNAIQSKTFSINNISFTMMPVEGGTFIMGATSEQTTGVDQDEMPIHQVTLDDYYIGKYEVTVSEFAEFIKATGYCTDAEKEGDSRVWKEGRWMSANNVTWRCDVKGYIRPDTQFDHPVIHVSWNDAMAYCEWLSKKTNKRFSLPTEAQWEYAARGGNQSNGFKYSGSNIIGDVSWYYDNSNSETNPVGHKLPNELNIYDMSGNVWEWCRDWYGLYTVENQVNPQGPSIGTYRVLRGGSWFNYMRDSRTSNRGSHEQDGRYNGSGFRIVWVE